MDFQSFQPTSESEAKREEAFQFLEQMEARHNQVLEDLDQLNERIEKVLSEYLLTRQPPPKAPEESPLVGDSSGGGIVAGPDSTRATDKAA